MNLDSNELVTPLQDPIDYETLWEYDNLEFLLAEAASQPNYED